MIISNKKIIKTEVLMCNICDSLTLHEIIIDFDTKGIKSIDCLKCKHKDDNDMYKSLEIMYDAGVRFSLDYKLE